MKHLLVGLVTLAAWGCGQAPTTEQLIITEIREMEAQIEDRERLNFMSHVAADFRGQGGRMDHDQLRALVVFQLSRYQNLDARLFPITVQEIGDNEATAEFRALLTGGSGWLPENGQLYKIRTHWRLDNGDWMLVAAWWDPVSIGELGE